MYPPPRHPSSDVLYKLVTTIIKYIGANGNTVLKKRCRPALQIILAQRAHLW